MQPQLKQLSWEDIRHKIGEINPKLQAIIDALAPDDSFKLYQANYAYGDIIQHHGNFYVPNKQHELVTLKDSSLDDVIKDDLSYVDGSPAGLVLTHSAGLYQPMGDRIIPSKLMYPGDFFALWRALEPEPSFHPSDIWTMTAGTRNIVSLPKITDTASHKRLMRDFSVRTPVPKNFVEHWHNFVQIARHRDFPGQWQSELLFFSKKWFEKSDDPAWQKFYHYLLESVWEHSSYFRNQFLWNGIFSKTLSQRDMRPDPHLVDTAKHLIAMSAGVHPGFTPAVDDIAAPVSGLQEVYLSCYGLKNYAPIFLHVTPPGFSGTRYYSLQFPTAFQFSPKSRRQTRIIQDLHELKHILAVFRETIFSGDINLSSTLIYQNLQTTKYDFFHSETDSYGEIDTTEKLPSEDARFEQVLTRFPDRVFAKSSTFLRGCVRLSKVI